MLCAAPITQAEKVTVTPHTDIAVHLVKRNYIEAGCDRWNSRAVKLLCAKLGDTPEVMAARMRITPGDFRFRMEGNRWTKQDGLILTLLNDGINFLKGAA